MIEVTPGKTPVGWIGTGVMGRSMCGHLLEAGFSATVYNRTPQKAQSLLDAGATWADSPRAVAEASRVIFAIVGYPTDVREVFLADHGILAGCREGHIVVDMTTSEPSLAVEIARCGESQGACMPSMLRSAAATWVPGKHGCRS